jgi:biopolymer transport protein TolR
MQLGSGSKSAGAGGIEVIAGTGVKSDINVTPLVDVCLVLLIIFMVVTPLLTQGHPVQLPETANPDKMPQGAKQLNLALEQDGSVFLEDKWLPEDQVLAKLQEIHENTPDKEVVIKADRRIKYAEVRKLMKAVNQAGFPGAGLVTQKKGTPAT